jgi:hypothetical protein
MTAAHRPICADLPAGSWARHTPPLLCSKKIPAGGSKALLTAALTLALGTATVAQAQDVPSGQPVTLTEVLTEDLHGQAYVRFRFLTPAIARDGGSVDAETAETDGFSLCETMALPYIKEYDLEADQIVVSFSDIPTTFGETSPEATQFFYQFRPENGTCIWELF